MGYLMADVPDDFADKTGAITFESHNKVDVYAESQTPLRGQ